MTSTISDLRASPRTDLVRVADHAFERDSPYRGEAFRNHCQRLYCFADLLLDQQRLDLDRDVLYALAMVHDLGLVNRTVQGRDYLRRSLALFRQEVGPLVATTEPRILEECLLLNHRVLPVPGVDRRSEMMRRAVWIEHTRGIRRYGLDRGAVRRVFDLHPRLDLDRVLVDFARRVIVREPVSIVRGIFF